MDFPSIWVILKAESCWAALMLYHIGNTTTNTNQIQNQIGWFVWLVTIHVARYVLTLQFTTETYALQAIQWDGKWNGDARNLKKHSWRPVGILPKVDSLMKSVSQGVVTQATQVIMLAEGCGIELIKLAVEICRKVAHMSWFSWVASSVVGKGEDNNANNSFSSTCSLAQNCYKVGIKRSRGSCFFASYCGLLLWNMNK